MRPLRTMIRSGLGVIVALVLVTGGACGRGADRGAAEEFRSALDATKRRDRFQFDYAEGGSRVTDCFLPNTSFTGEVDRVAGLLVLRLTPGGPVVGYVRDGRSVLSSALFRGLPDDVRWLATTGKVTGELRAGLVRALGSGLAGYVVDGLLPPSGEEIAAAAFDARATVTALPADDGTRRFAVRVAASRLAVGPADRPGDVTVEITFAGSSVERVVVTPGASSEAADATSGSGGARGWSIRYRRALEPPRAPDAVVTTELRSAADFPLAPPPVACELPVAEARP